MECGCNFWPNKKNTCAFGNPTNHQFSLFHFCFKGKLKEKPPERIKGKNERKEMSGKTWKQEEKKRKKDVISYLSTFSCMCLLLPL